MNEPSNLPTDPDLLRDLTHPNISLGNSPNSTASPLITVTLSLRELESVILQIAVVVAYLHERNIVHGDVHERHVFVTTAGRAILTGFDTAHKVARADVSLDRDVEALGQMIHRLSRPTLEAISVTVRESNRPEVAALTGTDDIEHDRRRALRATARCLTSSDERSRPSARDAVVMLRQLADATDLSFHGIPRHGSNRTGVPWRSILSRRHLVRFPMSDEMRRRVTGRRRKTMFVVPIVLATFVAVTAWLIVDFVAAGSGADKARQRGQTVSSSYEGPSISMSRPDSVQQPSLATSPSSSSVTSAPCERDCANGAALANGVLTANGQQYGLDNADSATLGRWTCSSLPTPAVLDGDELFVFDVWPTEGGTVSARHITTVLDAQSLRTEIGDGCDSIVVETSHTTVAIDPRRP